jgi:uroporphyrinogen-III synthase
MAETAPRLVLVTRPEPGASRTVARLAALGVTALATPLFSIVMTVAPRPKGVFQALIVTSANGASGLSPALAGLASGAPVLAVGDRTAAALRQNGFTDVRSAGGDQDDLAALAHGVLPPGAAVLMAVGEDRKAELEQALAAAGLRPTVWVRYKAKAENMLPETARRAIASGAVTHVLHYSRRAAETFTGLAGETPQGLTHLCLSADVAEGLGPALAGQVRIAECPDEAHLLALLATDSAAWALPDDGAVRDGAPHNRGTAPFMAAARDNKARRGKPAETPDAAETVASTDGAAVGSSPDAATPLSEAPTPSPDESHPIQPLSLPPGPPEYMPPPLPPHEPPADPESAATPPAASRGFGVVALFVTGAAAAVAGGLIAPLLQPLAERAGLATPAAKNADRLTALEAQRPAADPALAEAVRAAQAEAQRARQQAQALEQRLAELAARPATAAPAAPAAPDPAIAQLREGVQRAEAAAQAAGQSAAALAPRLAQVERAAQNVGAPSAAATAAAKMVMAERLQRIIAEGRPFLDELAALRAVGASPDALQRLAGAGAAGAPTITALTAAFRQSRAAMIVEPANTELSLTDRLLKLTDGLVRVRATGAVEGTSPAALAARIEQALQRGDAGAAAAAWAQLPEPGRRATEAFAAQLRARAGADDAARAIMDDAVKALAGTRQG